MQIQKLCWNLDGGPLQYLCQAEPSRAKPSPARAEPRRAKPSRAEPSQAEPSRAEPSRPPLYTLTPDRPPFFFQKRYTDR